MNILKKALTKDDIKRYQKKSIHNDQTGHMTKINQNSISNRNNWTDINQLIECVLFQFIQRGTYQKSVQSVVTQKVKSLIKKSFESGELTVSSDILIKSLLSIFEHYYHEQEFDYSRTNLNHKEQKILNLLELLEKMLKNDEEEQKNEQNKLISHQYIQELSICIDLTKKYLDNEVINRKNKELSEYEKIINVLKPSKKKQDKREQKRQNIQKLNKKLLSSLSSGNLHIKVTTQQISIQNGNKKSSEVAIEKKKSEGNLFKVESDKKIKLTKNQGQVKLENFFKDPSLKITKTTVQYDYNAIMEGSKSNLQFRNKTMQPDSNQKPTKNQSSVKNNFEVTNINKAKKDQAFVFYRPKPSKPQNKDK